VGTEVTGALRLGNADDGISVFNAAQNVIGGTQAGSGNVVSGNGRSGIAFEGRRPLQPVPGNPDRHPPPRHRLVEHHVRRRHFSSASCKRGRRHVGRGEQCDFPATAGRDLPQHQQRGNTWRGINWNLDFRQTRWFTNRYNGITSATPMRT
jgi:hypothetical protein